MMSINTQNILSKFAVLISILFILLSFNQINSTRVISYDIFGYYLYLPFSFIYNDLSISDFSILEALVEKYQNTSTLYQVSEVPGGGRVIKYSLGWAILMLPFFFCGHLIANLTDYPVDGLSVPYCVSIAIGGLTYTVIGIILIRKVLLKFFSDHLVSILIIALVFGTNYFHQATESLAMTHSILFTIYAAILYYTIKWHESPTRKNALLLGLFLGIAVATRPTEIIAIFIPLLWQVTSFKSLLSKLKTIWTTQRLNLLLLIFVFILCGIPQLAYWKFVTGKFLYYSYNNAGEGLDFLFPHTFDTLFSFRKGWYIYTPIMLMATLGIIYIKKYKPEYFWSFITFFCFNIYLISSWTCWWYAESFGQRALVQSYAVMLIPLGYLLLKMHEKKFTKILSYALILSFITLNLFQIWQVSAGILHESRMTFDYYKTSFGKTEVNHELREKQLLIDRSNDTDFKNINDYTPSTIVIDPYENMQRDEVIDTMGRKDSSSFLLTETHNFTPLFSKPYFQITGNDHAWVRSSYWVYPLEENNLPHFSLVTYFTYEGEVYFYRTKDISPDNLKANQWNEVTFDYLTPHTRTVNDKLNCYIWLRSSSKMLVDDASYTFYEKK